MKRVCATMNTHTRIAHNHHCKPQPNVNYAIHFFVLNKNFDAENKIKKLEKNASFHSKELVPLKI